MTKEQIAAELGRFFPGKQSLRNRAADAILALSRPVTVGREEIARIIFPYDSDPNRNYARWEKQRADALDKADAILALGPTVSPQDGGVAAPKGAE